MKKAVNFFGLSADTEFLLLLAALIILNIPDIIRYRIRPFLDEWAMDLIAKTKKGRKRKRFV